MIRLEIHTRMPQYEIDLTLPRLHLEQITPQVLVEREAPAVKIDLSEPLGDIGLKDTLALARFYRDVSQRKGLEAVARLAQEGDQFLEIHHGVTVTDVVAMRTDPVIPELTVEALPKSRPEIEFSGGVHISVEAGHVRGTFQPGAVSLRLHPGKVDVSAEAAPKRGQTVDFWV